MNILWKVIFIGIGATLFYDLWGLILKKLNLPSPNWKLAGRWFGYMLEGKFTHKSIQTVSSLSGETLIGWSMHYLIGIIYASLLIVIGSTEWIDEPTLLIAVLIGILTITAGWFLMSPAMGNGFASSKLNNILLIRIIQLMGHIIFGFGLYLSALLLHYLKL